MSLLRVNCSCCILTSMHGDDIIGVCDVDKGVYVPNINTTCA